MRVSSGFLRRRRFRILHFHCACALLITAHPDALAESFFDQLKGADGWFDTSDWVLNNAVGFMPVPIIITEPAVGEGLGLAALFFHPPKGYSQEEFETTRAQQIERQSDEHSKQQKFVLPNITAVAAAKTNNGTWFVGGGHFAHWKNDRVRYQGLVGYASINLQFYGGGGVPPIGNGIGFNIEGMLLQQPLSFRWKDSNFFFGGSYEFSKSKTSFKLLPNFVDPSRLNLEPTLSALGVFVTYDSRDTIFTPNNGMEAEIKVKRNDESLGSDFDFTHGEAKVRKYWMLNEKWVLGLRLEAQRVSGDVPFYAVPFISMRGIPAMRYQGKSVALAETEARWAFHRRISLVGFVGSGKAAKSWGDFGDSPSRTARGLGIRYFMAEKLGMHAGIDVARGPEESYWYLTIGGAWR